MTKPIVDSLYEVLHNGHDGEVANAPSRKQPGLKADVRKFGSERFLAGPNRIQLTHLGQILFQQHVFKARELVCGVDDGLNWQSSRSNLREAKRVLVLAEKLTVDILVPVDDPFIEIHRFEGMSGENPFGATAQFFFSTVSSNPVDSALPDTSNTCPSERRPAMDPSSRQ